MGYIGHHLVNTVERCMLRGYVSFCCYCCFSISFVLGLVSALLSQDVGGNNISEMVCCMSSGKWNVNSLTVVTVLLHCWQSLAVKINIGEWTAVSLCGRWVTEYCHCTGLLKIKYPTRQCAISLQPVVWFLKSLKLLNPDTSVNLTLYNVSIAP